MAKISTELIQKIKNYIDKIEQKGIKINQVYLFGSYARAEETEFSDVDIALISDDFDGSRFLDNEKILGLQHDIDYRFSPYPIKTSDLIDNFFIKSEILQKGIKLF